MVEISLGAAAVCPDCQLDPCRCAAWDAEEHRYQNEEAERVAFEAETQLPYLWETGSDGLLRRKR